ncbi:hypothetical protein TNCV_2532151 [Trichonephila clavipes]|nr:hypothetical protein TNCV_2532151 [Trichonephila clavipes]
MTTRISLTTSLGVRNSLPKFRKAAVYPVVSHLAVLRAMRMKGSFSDQQSCLSWTRIASLGFRSLFFRSTGLACGCQDSSLQETFCMGYRDRRTISRVNVVLQDICCFSPWFEDILEGFQQEAKFSF